jgi:PAS domain S-box-containing protein
VAYAIAFATLVCAWLAPGPYAAAVVSVLVVAGLVLHLRAARVRNAGDAERDRLRSAWELSEEYALFVDDGGRIMDVTPAFARLLGRERSKLHATPLVELAPDHDLRRALGEASNGTDARTQLTLETARGERAAFDMTVRALDGGAALVVLRQTVAPARAELTSAELNASGTALVAVIERAAHDLNNILSAIAGNLDLARQDVGPVHPARESLDEILSATHRARAVGAALMQASPRRLRPQGSGDARAVTKESPVTGSEHASAADAPKAAENQTSPAGSEGGKLVLYLDDDEPLTDIVGRLLLRKGYRVASHTDVAQALADFRKRAGEFSLVVTDLNLPNASGLDIAREVRSLRPDVEVVLVSGFFRADEVEAARAAGIEETLVKANSAHEFVADLTRYLTR